MTGSGWATGSDIQSRGYSHIPDEDWDRIFGKKNKDGNKTRDIPKKKDTRTNTDPDCAVW